MARWPQYDEEQIADVAAVLRSGEVNAWTGPHVRRFEEAYAMFLGRRHAIALMNGSVALDLALFALGIEAGDEVIVTPRSFVASASCVVLCGAVPVFADVDDESQNVTAATIATQISERTKAIIVVHLAGRPCELQPIVDLCSKHRLWLIEDCAQAHGAEYRGRPVGSFGDIASFSFCQDKIITTGGEGGLLAMDDDRLWERAWYRKDHGKALEKVRTHGNGLGFKWLHDHFGSNYRMTGMQAVLGLKQLQRLPDWLSHRSRNAEILFDATSDLPALRTPRPPNHMRHAWYRFYTFVRPDRLKLGWDRDRILLEIQKYDVPCFTGSCPEIYREKCFIDKGLGPATALPTARSLGDTSLCFLVDPCQDEAKMTRTADAIRNAVTAATKA